jgi:hypothetical protein
LTDTLLICPSCYYAAAIAVDLEGKSPAHMRHPVPHEEGRFAIVTNVGAGRGGREGAGRRTALMRTAKSCGSDAPMLALSYADVLRSDGDNKAGRQGEHGISRKTIVQGMPG